MVTLFFRLKLYYSNYKSTKLKRLKFYIIPLVLMLAVNFGCSLKKNTWQTRKFQEISTRFNVYFNGITSYEEGLDNIAKANQEDYSTIIPMYPISRHSNAQSAKSNMDRCIEKCRKAIKLRSIKQKPERNSKKWKDAEYQLWYKQEEFNPALKDAWLLLAKSEFHKADFLGAVGTFTYIMRHYENDKDMVAQCQLWLVRSYAEMGWIYEAEQVLSNVKQDQLKWNIVPLFAAVNADLLLKKGQYKEAVPFLEIALKNETNKTNKLRFSYLLAQLYQKTGNNTAALETFKKLIKQNPPFEMELNARIHLASLDPNVSHVRKSLTKMLKNPNNKEYKDQIYYAIGNTYLHQKDTARAITNYNKSVESSTRNGIDKAVTLVTLGDIYYETQKYILAQPCYDEAAKLFPVDYADYQRISKRSETLSELVSQYEIVHLQDSLQKLSRLPEEERLAVVNKVIEKVIADEKAAQEAADNKALISQNPEDEPMGPPIGMQNMGNWYFYNPALMQTGKTDFQRRWGKRKLEDNWRRTSKSSSLFAEDNSGTQTPPANNPENNQQTTESNTVAPESDNKKSEFYLQQIPVSPAQIQKSNDDLAEALFNMGMIYKDKVEDYEMAAKTFEEYLRRFPAKTMASEACFQLYLINVKLNNQAKAEVYRQKLIAEFPDSKYVKILSQPDFIQQQQRMYHEQDSLYTQSYNAFNANKFDVVKQNSDYIEKNYPSSEILPKFIFLKTLSIGKTEKKDVFEKSLNDLISKFPESDVSSMAKDILALIKQGLENKAGTSQGTLLTKREESIRTSDTISVKSRQLTADKTLKHRILFVIPSNTKQLNDLMYNVAVYNFTRFIMKDFDMATNTIDSTRMALSVIGFENFDEAQWYLTSIQNDENMNKMLNEQNAQKIIISEENFGLIKTMYTLDEYLTFYKKLLSATPEKVITKTDNQQVPKQNTNTVKNDVKPINNNNTKPVVNEPKPVVTEQKNTAPVANNTTIQNQQVKTPAAEVPLFKNLFAYKPNDPHFVAITVLSGNFDFNKLKEAFDAYNTKNYNLLNLKVNMETVGTMKVVIVGSFADAAISKSYLYRMVGEKSITSCLNGTNFRNLMGTQENLNVMMENNAMTTYFEFMQQYYLK